MVSVTGTQARPPGHRAPRSGAPGTGVESVRGV